MNLDTLCYLAAVALILSRPCPAVIALSTSDFRRAIDEAEKFKRQVLAGELDRAELERMKDTGRGAPAVVIPIDSGERIA